MRLRSTHLPVLKTGAMEAEQKPGVTVVFRTPTKFDVAERSVVTESALSTPNLTGVAVVAADPNSLEA
jgi:ABC-type sugar transport system substrate-binding protein